MAASALLDTGAILALLDRDDRRYSACVKAFSQIRAPLLTSEAVLTELFHLVASRRQEVDAAWKFVRSGALTLATITDSDLPTISYLMDRYRDRPMDFADATLVHLAERDSLSTVLTVDFADFQTYRIAGTKRFRILPDPKSSPDY
jgi:predicted nucleic acid-binding protein